MTTLSYNTSIRFRKKSGFKRSILIKNSLEIFFLGKCIQFQYWKGCGMKNTKKYIKMINTRLRRTDKK